jgi:hypothetical protein
MASCVAFEFADVAGAFEFADVRPRWNVARRGEIGEFKRWTRAGIALGVAFEFADVAGAFEFAGLAGLAGAGRLNSPMSRSR